MALDFLILFALAFAFWWLAGRLIDDVLDQVDAQWGRFRAHERIGRRK